MTYKPPEVVEELLRNEELLRKYRILVERRGLAEPYSYFLCVGENVSAEQIQALARQLIPDAPNLRDLVLRLTPSKEVFLIAPGSNSPIGKVYLRRKSRRERARQKADLKRKKEGDPYSGPCTFCGKHGMCYCCIECGHNVLDVVNSNGHHSWCQFYEEVK